MATIWLCIALLGQGLLCTTGDLTMSAMSGYTAVYHSTHCCYAQPLFSVSFLFLTLAFSAQLVFLCL